ncbi:MAG TPA: hypothetical protein VGL69_01650 [Solirubrobacteraceae bacterium]|jgi:hypothetical protein
MKKKFGPRRLAGKLTYANVVATLALMLAISGGTALAATHLITGKQIAKGTISATNIKKHTLTSTLFKKGVKLRGARGATGPAGAAGAAGAPGAAGSAIAYGLIENNGNGNPAFVGGLSAGFTAVYSPSTGTLCVAYPAGVTTNLPLSITDASNETGRWEQVNNGACGGSGFALGNLSGGGLTGALSISVP